MTEDPAMNERERRDAERRHDAHATLDRLESQTETLGSSAFVRMADKARTHFTAAEVDQEDRIEVWASRVGRILGLLFAIGLVIHLVSTYVLK